ncbi:MAG: sigma-54-dependent Fis family transcriptional regulator, partial [Nitrospinae bacterium]|nr:sigma-54-dependent Fis family transcriptional regulator [Nitrospinota bacterium]
EDDPHLVKHFIANWEGRHRKKICGATDAALSRLMDYDWPGNVRELENAIEYACVKCGSEKIGPDDLPPLLLHASSGTKRKKRNRVTRESILEALSQTNYNQTRAARLLDLHRITLWRKMKEFDINPR